MFALDRFVPFPVGRHPARVRRSARPTRRRASNRRFERIRSALPLVCGVGIAAVVGWLLAAVVCHQPRCSSANRSLRSGRVAR